MDGNTELLDFVYQNSEMGVDTINRIIQMVENKAFAKQLEQQLTGYRSYSKDAKRLLHQRGHDEKGITAFEKLRTYLMIDLQTMTDRSCSHIAGMLIQGSTMGIVDAIRKLRRYNDADQEIMQLLEQLQRFEENNVERLKPYL